jgi:hypothetical protein
MMQLSTILKSIDQQTERQVFMDYYTVLFKLSNHLAYKGKTHQDENESLSFSHGW